MLSSTSMLVPLLSNRIVKFWFLELPKTHLEFLTTHQERQRSYLQLTIATAIPKKGKAPVIIEIQKSRLPRTLLPQTPTGLTGWCQPDESQTAQTCRSELTHLGLDCWEAPGAALPCINSSHWHWDILKSSTAFYLPATAQWPDLTVNCHLYHLQPPSDKPVPSYRVSFLFIQLLNMMLLITHFGQAVLKYTPTVT